MRSVKSVEDLFLYVRTTGCQCSSLASTQHPIKSTIRPSSAPAMNNSVNLSKLRHVTERQAAKKETRRRPVPPKREAPSEPRQIGDSTEVSPSTKEPSDKAGSDQRRFNEKVRVSSEETTVSTVEGDNVGEIICKGESSRLKNGGPANQTTVIDGGTQTNSKLEEIFSLKEVPERIDLNVDTPEDETPSKASRKKRSLYTTVLIWSLTFSLASSLYFLAFVYVYKTEPIFSNLKRLWGEEPVPPPVTFKEKIQDFIMNLNFKLGYVHSSLMQVMEPYTGFLSSK